MDLSVREIWGRRGGARRNVETVWLRGNSVSKNQEGSGNGVRIGTVGVALRGREAGPGPWWGGELGSGSGTVVS